MSINKNAVTGLTKNKYTISGQSVQSINFLGTNPNYYRITNGSASDIYLGVSMTPTTDFFDMKIPSASTKMFVDAYGHDTIYLYNPSTEPCNIIILSFNAEFNPTVLAMTDVGQDFTDIEINTNTSITGFETALPNGNNTIGKVILSDEDKAVQQTIKINTQASGNAIYHMSKTFQNDDGSYEKGSFLALKSSVDTIKDNSNTMGAKLDGIKNAVENINVTVEGGTDNTELNNLITSRIDRISFMKDHYKCVSGNIPTMLERCIKNKLHIKAYCYYSDMILYDDTSLEFYNIPIITLPDDTGISTVIELGFYNMARLENDLNFNNPSVSLNEGMGLVFFEESPITNVTVVNEGNSSDVTTMSLSELDSLYLRYGSMSVASGSNSALYNNSLGKIKAIYYEDTEQLITNFDNIGMDTITITYSTSVNNKFSITEWNNGQYNCLRSTGAYVYLTTNINENIVIFYEEL